MRHIADADHVARGRVAFATLPFAIATAAGADPPRHLFVGQLKVVDIFAQVHVPKNMGTLPACQAQSG